MCARKVAAFRSNVPPSIPANPPFARLTLVLTSAGSLHSSSRPLTMPKAKLTGLLRDGPSAPLSGAGVPVPSPLRRLLRGADGPAEPRARLPATEGVGEGASCGGMDGRGEGVENKCGLLVEMSRSGGWRCRVEGRHGSIFMFIPRLVLPPSLRGDGRWREQMHASESDCQLPPRNIEWSPDVDGLGCRLTSDSHHQHIHHGELPRPLSKLTAGKGQDDTQVCRR